MKVTPSIFKAYDIRGVVGQTLDEQVAEHLGRAFGTEAVKAGEKAVAVGRDGRLSGPRLAAALMRGLAAWRRESRANEAERQFARNTRARYIREAWRHDGLGALDGGR